MIKNQLLEIVSQKNTQLNQKFKLELETPEILVYENSVQKYDDYFFLIGTVGIKKYLFIYTDDDNDKLLDKFEGELLLKEENKQLKKCPFIHTNVIAIQDLFTFTRPVVVGLKNSFGFGSNIIANYCRNFVYG